MDNSSIEIDSSYKLSTVGPFGRIKFAVPKTNCMQQKKIIITGLTVLLILAGNMLYAGRISTNCCKNLKNSAKDLVAAPIITDTEDPGELPAPLLPAVLYF
jgi:hypothetical protein